MKKVTLSIPDHLNINEREVAVMLAAQLYGMGKLSLGQAADLVGMSKEAFMDELGKYKVSLFGETMKDIARDLKNA